MIKKLEGLFSRRNFSKKDLRKVISKNKGKALCYVLITCRESEDDGSMDVDMKYDGERWLAAYLIKSAQNVIEDGIEDE